MSASRVLMIVALLALASHSVAREPAELREARQAHEKGPQTESARASYITKLVHMRQRFASADNKAWQVVDAEIMRHPASPDSTTFSRSIVGKWRSPRHDYTYRRNATWSMLPVEPNTTAGTWHFEGNVCVETNILGTFRYTTLLLTAEDYVCTDGEVVFFRKRLHK